MGGALVVRYYCELRFRLGFLLMLLVIGVVTSAGGVRLLDEKDFEPDFLESKLAAGLSEVAGDGGIRFVACPEMDLHWGVLVLRERFGHLSVEDE